MNKVSSELLFSYPIPLLLAIVAWCPLNFVVGLLFSPHGGLGWLLLLCSFPWLIVRLVVLLFSEHSQNSEISRDKHAMAVLVGYLPVSITCAYSLIFALNPPLTNSLFTVLPWFYFPLSVAVDGW